MGSGQGIQVFTLSPANSVWIINCGGYPTNNITDLYEVCQSVHPGTSTSQWTMSTPVANGASGIWFSTPGSANNFMSSQYGLTPFPPLCFTYIVPPYNAGYTGSTISGSTTSQSLIYGWSFASVSNQKINVDFTIRATRIA